MTLIELIYNYAWRIKHIGRDGAEKELRDMGVSKNLIPHIRKSVNDSGEFLTALDDVFIPYPIE